MGGNVYTSPSTPSAPTAPGAHTAPGTREIRIP